MGEAATLHGIARVECVHGNLIEARKQIETALGIIESQRTNVASPDLRASFKASKQDYYEFYVDTLMRLHQREPNNGHDAAALQASERARARSLLDMLTEARADIRQGVEPELLEQERTLQRQLNAKAERLTRLLSEKRAEEQAAALRKELGDLLTQYQGVEGQIRTSSPRYAALTQPQPLSLNEIQQQVLDENTLLLEYALGEEKSYLWAVTPTSLASFELPKRSEIESAARRLYDLFTAPSQPVKGETPRQQKHRLDQAGAEYARVAVALSKMLLEPVAAQLGTKRLLIVADEALQYVPFAALPRTEKEKGKRKKEKGKEKDVLTDEPLITGHEIVTLPSASALAVLRQELAGRVQSPKTIAVLADPVFTSDDSRVRLNMVRKKSQPQPAKPGETLVVSLDANRLRSAAEETGLQRFNRLDQSRVEAQAIAALAPEDRRLTALDFTANRAIATSDDLKQYRIVHFATHGLLNSKHPELSGVVLSLVDERGRPQDGFLRLHDIYNLKLNADLVVLSACQTALGKHIKGEGLIGLTRGFMYAGAARVMASLWKVEDEATAELMRRFYDGMLGQGLSPAAALRAAQVSMWEGNKKRWRHPFYWAGFVLQGECK
jgi:CHAT domain-containing protein